MLPAILLLFLWEKLFQILPTKYKGLFLIKNRVWPNISYYSYEHSEMYTEEVNALDVLIPLSKDKLYKEEEEKQTTSIQKQGKLETSNKLTYRSTGDKG